MESGQTPGSFAKFLKEYRNVVYYTMHGSPYQNDVTKRRNQTLIDMVKSMRSNVKLFSSCGLKYLR